jgi:hypothetical protein
MKTKEEILYQQSLLLSMSQSFYTVMRSKTKKTNRMKKIKNIFQ